MGEFQFETNAELRMKKKIGSHMTFTLLNRARYFNPRTRASIVSCPLWALDPFKIAFEGGTGRGHLAAWGSGLRKRKLRV